MIYYTAATLCIIGATWALWSAYGIIRKGDVKHETPNDAD